MGLFSNLKKAIFKKTGAKPKRSRRNPSTDKPTPPEDAKDTKSDASLSPGTVEITPATPAGESSASETLSAAELTSQLDQLEKDHPEDLAWRSSIVDLMKLVEMDSSYAERKEMAIDLGYSEADIDSKGSAEMNMWLHKKVLAKLSEDTDGDLTAA